MADRLYVLAALATGACAALAVLLAVRPTASAPAARWLERRRGTTAAIAARLRGPRLPGPAARSLAARLERAGWSETPDRFAALTAVVAAALGAGGAAVGALGGPRAAALLALVGTVAGGGLCLRLLVASGSARRRRLLAELAPTLELTCLELGAGSSPAAALAAVTRRTEGELARELRRVLATATLASGEPLDAGLRRLGERLDLPPLAAVAAVIASSRDYGSGVLHGLRAIAIDLRRAQRRELIATSRSALTRVLVPSAVGVLMPFLAILLYPAVTSLAANLR